MWRDLRESAASTARGHGGHHNRAIRKRTWKAAKFSFWLMQSCAVTVAFMQNELRHAIRAVPRRTIV
jgi:hypothetical protein